MPQPKELYLYSTIYDFVAQELIAEIEASNSEDIVIRNCSPGGSVNAGWGIVAKLLEYPGNIKMKCDGLVASMAFYIILFLSDVECLDTTQFIVHRADMYVDNADDQAYLDDINSQLKKKLSAKVDSAKFKEITGYSINEIFDPSKRIEVRISGSDAKKLGLVKKVNPMTPAAQKEIIAFQQRFNAAASVDPKKPIEKIKKPTIKMEGLNKVTADKLKADAPKLFAQILAMGVAKEKERVGAWMAFNDVDPEAVKAAIEGEKDMTSKDMAEFSRKTFSAEALAKLDKDGKPIKKVETEGVTAELTEDQKKIKEFQDAVIAKLTKKV